MASATLNLKISPRRMLDRREAAEYCGLQAARFAGDCTVAAVEMPNGKRLYDIRDLDRWLDAIKGGDFSGDDDILRKLD